MFFFRYFYGWLWRGDGDVTCRLDVTHFCSGLSSLLLHRLMPHAFLYGWNNFWFISSSAHKTETERNKRSDVYTNVKWFVKKAGDFHWNWMSFFLLFFFLVGNEKMNNNTNDSLCDIDSYYNNQILFVMVFNEEPRGLNVKFPFQWNVCSLPSNGSLCLY